MLHKFPLIQSSYGNIVPIESIIPPTAKETELVELIDRNRSKLFDRLTTVYAYRYQTFLFFIV